jgi:acyl carrier protein
MIFEKLKKIIAEHFGVDESSLSLRTDFANDLGADSLDVVELIFDVEEAFSLDEMDEEEVKKVATMEDLCDYISARI